MNQWIIREWVYRKERRRNKLQKNLWHCNVKKEKKKKREREREKEREREREEEEEEKGSGVLGKINCDTLTLRGKKWYIRKKNCEITNSTQRWY